MTRIRAALRGQEARMVALAIVVGLGMGSREPQLDAEMRSELARSFAFTMLPIDVETWAPHLARQTRRRVNPSLRGHDAWISAVGAAIALADLDDDGLPNDLCIVDPRVDAVGILPVPGTGERYLPFVLWQRSGADATVAPMGCVPGDLDEDGSMDVLLYFWGRPPLALLRRPGPVEASAYVAREIADPSARWYSTAATFADLDGDGHADLILGNYFQDGARILDPTAEQADAMQHSMSRAANGGRTRIFRWIDPPAGEEPDVRYVEIEHALPERVAHGWTLALGAADVDGDLRPELYVAQDFGPDALLHNRSEPGAIRLVPVRGEKGFLVPSSKVLGRDSFKGMSAEFADLNQDGRLDIYVSNITTPYGLQESHFAYLNTGDPGSLSRGIAPFVDASEPLGLARSGWGWDTRVEDFDNDGDPEAVQATGFVRGRVDRWPELQELATANDELLRHPEAWPHVNVGDDLSGEQRNPFFVLADDGRYYDLSREIGISEPYVTRGIATADVDGDGDVDMAIANQWQASQFFRNDARGEGASLILRLLLPVDGGGAGAGRPAIGAVARVARAEGAPLVRHVDGGNGHSGVRSPELHFGLGEADPGAPVEVEITWRDAGGVHRARRSLRPGRHTWLLNREES